MKTESIIKARQAAQLLASDLREVHTDSITTGTLLEERCWYDLMCKMHKLEAELSQLALACIGDEEETQ